MMEPVRETAPKIELSFEIGDLLIHENDYDWAMKQDAIVRVYFNDEYHLTGRIQAYNEGAIRISDHIYPRSDVLLILWAAAV